jgi:hypothetical protein
VKKIVACLLMLAGSVAAHAYEFKLQFSPRAGARGLSVVGYYFSGSTVVGNCSYHTVISNSSGSTTIYYNSTCTWDLYGNLLSTVSGSPTAPAPIEQLGNETVYANNGTNLTGSDIRGYGFVSTPSAHVTWTTANGTHAVITDRTLTLPVNFTSDGDFAVDVSEMTISAIPTGFLTPTGGTATVTFACTTVPPGQSCVATITYQPQTITCTASAYGYAYTEVILGIPKLTPFTEGFTVTGVPYCNGS